MIKIIGKSLYQWDLNRQIEIDNLPDGTDITEVNFAHPGDEEAMVVTPAKNGNTVIANIPNILLQSDKDIFIYVCVGDVTICSKRKNVHSRPRPADYVYTETQIKQWDDLCNEVYNGVGEVINEEFTSALQELESYCDENVVPYVETSSQSAEASSKSAESAMQAAAAAQTASEQAATSAMDAEKSARAAAGHAQAMAGTYDFTGYLRYQIVDAVPDTYEEGVLYIGTFT